MSSVGIVSTKYFTFADEKGKEFRLISGKTLSPVTIAYETYGVLNEQKSNSILILHALSGDAHVAGYHSEEGKKIGWWDNIIGPGKAIDTNLYYVICSNVLGGCSGSTGPGSINPATNKPYGLDFPFITVFDMVNAQKELVSYLGITKLTAVIGGSMGGMQALAWSTEFPDMVRGAVIVASTSSHSAQCIAFNEVGRQAIVSDQNFQGGAYYNSANPENGLAVARMIGHITYLSDESMDEKFGRRFQDIEPHKIRNKIGYQYDLGTNAVFQIESYLRHQGSAFNLRFDANSYLVITKAIDHFDLGQYYGSLLNAFKKVKAKFLVISYTSDWLYPTHHSKQIVKAMLKAGANVSFSEIKSQKGHDAFLLEDKYLSSYVSTFLKSIGTSSPHE